MSQEMREILQVLRYELNYLEQGGFERDQVAVGATSPFLESFTCINYGDPLHSHACRECKLFPFVPEDKRNEELPCHFIRLGPNGETMGELIAKGDSRRLVTVLKNWLRATIARMEATLEREDCAEAEKE
jgi:hypothetical protein